MFPFMLQIPIDLHPGSKKSGVETVLTVCCNIHLCTLIVKLLFTSLLLFVNTFIFLFSCKNGNFYLFIAGILGSNKVEKSGVSFLFLILLPENLYNMHRI